MKIGTKLFLAFMLIAIISTFISTYRVTNSISERYADLLEDEILKLKKSTENRFYSNLGAISRKSFFISELDEVVNNIETPDEIVTDLELKVIFLSSINTYIADPQNKILCSLNKSKTNSIDQKALNNNPFFSNMGKSLLRKTGILKIGKKISLISVSPIVNQDTFEKLGSTILEQEIDSEFADKIRDNYRSEILIYSNEKEIGTTFINSNGERHYPEILNFKTGKIEERQILNDNYLLDSFPIEDYEGKKIGEIIVFLNINKIIMARRAGARSILRTTIMVFFITVFLSIIIGRRFSKPIQNLSKSASSISQGNFNIKIEPTSRDEIGELTILFNEMTESLKSQTEHIKHISFYLKNIIDSMPSILVGIDSDGLVTQWNSEAEKKTGIKRETASGKLIEELFPQFREQLNVYKESIRNKTPYNMEKILMRTGDFISYTDIMIYPLITNGVTGAVIRMDDVTERVRIEEMMIQTEKMMSVGGLAAGMAHEINNPLGGILIGIQNIQRRLSQDFPANIRVAKQNNIDLNNMHNYLKSREIHDFLNGIKEAGERASNIVDNMLSFSRHSKSDFLPANLTEILDKTIELAENDYSLKKKYDFKHLKIIRDYEKNIPDVICIKTEIQQVILNLLKNAVYSMFEDRRSDRPEPKLFLSIKLDGELVKIEIEDNGTGIDKETCKRIFEPFFTTKDIGTGTGLGLSVSYFIITNIHKGSLYVESTTGKGTIFTIKIPVAREDQRL